ncbi:MAG: hypothetical protein R3B12_00355 [Candidatus Saccharimonadales bacterium]
MYNHTITNKNIMTNSGEKFIHSKYKDLHHSIEVETIIDYLRIAGEKIPNSPE